MTASFKITNKAIAAACVLSAAGALVFNAFPLFLSTLATEFAFGEEQLGLLGTYYLGGAALVALFAPIWVPALPTRITAAGGFGLIFLSLAWLGVAESDAVHWSMALFGMGSSCIFTLGLGVLSAAPNPDRAYGFKLSTEMVLGAITMFVMTSFVLARFGYVGFLWAAAAIYVVSALGLTGMPAKFLRREERTEIPVKPRSSKAVVIASVALFVQFGTFSGLWGFMERFGVIRNIESDVVGSILSLSLLAGLAAALIAAALGNRFGQKWPILIGMFLTLVAVQMLMFGDSVIAYALAACLMNALVQFLVVYQMALVTVLDENGRFTLFIAFILTFSGAFGPGILGSIIERTGYDAGLQTSLAMTIVAMSLTWIATRKMKPGED